MNESRPPYRLQAPGTSASLATRRPPSRGGFPHVDAHLDPPETTRWERVGGRRVEASPAKAPHAMRHGDLDYVVRGKVAPGYRVASDLKTRFDKESDFASDTAILQDGIDPRTGRRHLEEVAFEVVSTQNLRDVTEKAPKMRRRGVRRVFAVFLKKGTVSEWSEEKQSWVALDRSSVIQDRCLIEPLEVEALLDAAAADNAVARGLVARGNPVIEKLQETKLAEGKAEAVLEVLEARDLAVSDDLRRRILGTTDLDQLRRWLKRATLVDSADDLEVVG